MSFQINFCCFAVKLQKCFEDEETLPNFPVAKGWVNHDWIFIFFGCTVSLNMCHLFFFKAYCLCLFCWKCFVSLPLTESTTFLLTSNVPTFNCNTWVGLQSIMGAIFSILGGLNYFCNFLPSLWLDVSVFTD